MSQEIQKSRFFKLYNGVQPRLYAFIMAVVHNPVDTEDILQEAAIIMWEKFDRYEEGTSFGAWSVTIARNKAMEFIRKNKNSRMVFDDSFYDQVSEYSSKATSQAQERNEALSDCLKKLSQSNKELLALRYKKNMPVKRISKISGRSLNGLYQSYTLIISKLRSCIDKKIAQQEV